jgi:hypothetical protein
MLGALSCANFFHRRSSCAIGSSPDIIVQFLGPLACTNRD